MLNETLQSKHIILASHSPRRRELLKAMDIDYTLAESYEVEEVYPPSLAAAEVPSYLSRLKSKSYPEPLSPDDILITADTVVICGGEIMGKPHSEQDAENMLHKLSGRTHTVVTGVTLRDARHTKTFAVRSDVKFRTLTAEEIRYYVAKYKPLDKAGAYGIQEWIGCTGIERVEGSFYNVMGLPTATLYKQLQNFIR